jgi:hypothetical protein
MAIVGLLVLLALAAAAVYAFDDDHSRSHASGRRRRRHSRSRSRSHSRERLQRPCVRVLASTSTSITLELTDRSCEACRFEVQYRTACPEGQWMTLSYSIPSGEHVVSALVPELQPDTLYAFRVRVHADCGQSEWECTNSSTQLVPPPPPAPVSLGLGFSGAKAKGLSSALETIAGKLSNKVEAKTEKKNAAKPKPKGYNPVYTKIVKKYVLRGDGDKFIGQVKPKAGAKPKDFGDVMPAPDVQVDSVTATALDIRVSYSLNPAPDMVQLQYIIVPPTPAGPDTYTWTVLESRPDAAGFSQFNVTGLSPDQPYAFRARCIRYLKDPSPFSPIIYQRTEADLNNVGLAPAMPTGLALARSSPTELEFTFNTTEVSGDVYHQVQYADQSAGLGDWKELKVPASTSSPVTFSITGLSPNTTYYVRIRSVRDNANDNAYESVAMNELSNIVFAVTDFNFEQAFDAPFVEVKEVTESKIFLRVQESASFGPLGQPQFVQVQWDDDGDLSSLLWNVRDLTPNFVGTPGAGWHEYTITGLVPSTNYGLRVRFLNTTGTTAPSPFTEYQVSTGTTGVSGTVVGAPTVTVLSVTTSSASLQILPDNATTLPDNFSIEYIDVLNTFAWSSVSLAYSATNVYSLTMLNADTTYYLRVRAANNNGPNPVIYGPYSAPMTQFQTAPSLLPVLSTYAIEHDQVTNISVHLRSTATDITNGGALPMPDSLRYQLFSESGVNPTDPLQIVQQGVVSPTGNAFDFTISTLAGFPLIPNWRYQVHIVYYKAGYTPSPKTTILFATAKPTFGQYTNPLDNAINPIL